MLLCCCCCFNVRFVFVFSFRLTIRGEIEWNSYESIENFKIVWIVNCENYLLWKSNKFWDFHCDFADWLDSLFTHSLAQATLFHCFIYSVSSIIKMIHDWFWAMRECIIHYCFFSFCSIFMRMRIIETSASFELSIFPRRFAHWFFLQPSLLYSILSFVPVAFARVCVCAYINGVVIGYIYTVIVYIRNLSSVCSDSTVKMNEALSKHPSIDECLAFIIYQVCPRLFDKFVSVNFQNKFVESFYVVIAGGEREKTCLSNNIQTRSCKLANYLPLFVIAFDGQFQNVTIKSNRSGNSPIPIYIVGNFSIRFLWCVLVDVVSNKDLRTE